jgi:TrmH family RNA methyltransferase
MLLGAYRQPEAAWPRIDRAAAPLWIVAQALRDPGNIGTILRTGDAVGAGGLILIDDCADPFSVEAVRASMGAVFTQQIASAAGTSSSPGCAPGRAAGRHQPQGHHDYLEADLRAALLPADRQRAAGPARRL